MQQAHGQNSAKIYSRDYQKLFKFQYTLLFCATGKFRLQTIYGYFFNILLFEFWKSYFVFWGFNLLRVSSINYQDILSIMLK